MCATIRVTRRELSDRMELMTKTYTQIVKQIEALKLEADKMRKQEVDVRSAFLPLSPRITVGRGGLFL